MNETIFLAGVVLLIAAIAGGGLNLAGIAVPPIDSVRRQVTLAIAGLVLIVMSLSWSAWCARLSLCPAPVTPTLTATSTPTATLTPMPTPTLTPTLPWVTITDVVASAPGGLARVTAETLPGAFCSIAYVTPAGTTSEADGLEPQTASGDGNVSWSWTISANTRSGIGTVTVNCGGVTDSAPITID